MGPYLGGLGIPIFLPLLVWAAAFYCSGKDWPRIPTSLPTVQDFKNSFSWQAMGAYTAWWLFQAFLYLVVPGEIKEGTLLRDGNKLKYPINGWNSLLITAVTAALFHVYVHPLTWIADNFLQLSTAAIIFSYVLSIYLYVSSFGKDKKNNRNEKLLAVGGNSGNFLYDFFIGRELNPRVTVPIFNKEIDLKYFCELRPGLFGWILINASMAIKQIQTQGGLSSGMIIVQLLQALYVADSVFCEDCILTTMDIIQDGFGFMLVFGDLAWVPCLYSLQSRYLSSVVVNLSNFQAAAILALGILGFTIFRKANAQKDTFKKNPNDPSVKDLKFIQTKTGSRLLADGWWGKSRHINYFGDWMLSVAMSLPCGESAYKYLKSVSVML
jgi:Ergosterol biosynthesis ERG4/ERG24 family